MGAAGRVGFRPRLVAARRLRMPPRAPSSRSPRSRSSASFAPAAIIGRRAPSRRAGGPRSVDAAAARPRPHPPESFYGLLARETLGMDTKLPADPFTGFDPPIDQLPNVQRAIELARIGEPALAEEMLRHQAKIGAPDRASCADPARQEARPSGGAAVARQQRPAGRPLRCRRPLSQPALERRSTAGGSIRRSPSATSSRNRPSAAPRSAPPARSA